MKFANSLTSVVLLAGLGYGIAIAAQSYKEEKSLYYGAELFNTKVFVCQSNDVVSAGYYNYKKDEKGIEKEKPVPELITSSSKEKNFTTWKITIKGDQAEVITASGTFGGIEDPEAWKVIGSDNEGIMLLKTGTLLNANAKLVETITVDPKNSSFVLSAHNMIDTWHRVNTWHGSCGL